METIMIEERLARGPGIALNNRIGASGETCLVYAVSPAAQERAS